MEAPKPEEDLGRVEPPGIQIVESHVDKARRRIVYVLLTFVLITILTPFPLLLFGVSLTEKHWEFLHIIFPAEVTLLGAAVAFYFERRS